MKRLLSLFAAVVLLLPCLSSCKDVNVVVTATVQLTYYDLSAVTCGPMEFGPYHHTYATEYEIKAMLSKLTRNVNKDFATGLIHLELYDTIENRYLTPQDYSIMWDDYERDWVIQEM